MATEPESTTPTATGEPVPWANADSEATTATDTRPPNAAAIVPLKGLTVQTLIDRAFGALGKLNLGNFLPSIRPGLKIEDVLASTLPGNRITLQEAESRIPTKNLKEVLNPLGTAPDLFGAGQDIFALISDLLDDDDVDFLFEAERIDALRLEIFTINNNIKLMMTNISATVDFWDQSDLEAWQAAVAAFDLILTIFVSDELNGANAKEQLNQLRTAVSKLNRKITAVFEESQDAVDIINEINRVLHEYARQVVILIEDIRSMVGVYVERGSRQDIDVNGFLSDSPVSRQYDDARNSFLSGSSSVAHHASPHPSSGTTALDAATRSQDQLATNAQGAVASNDQGGETQAAQQQSGQSTETTAATGTVGPLDDAGYATYINVLGNRESGNNYGAVNQIGYSGRWQFGGLALQDMGYCKAGVTARKLKNDSSWTGKDGISSQQDWLSNSSVQDSTMLRFTRRNYKSLLSMGVVSSTSNAATVAGYLAVAHLLGTGGARDFKNGKDGADGNGTKASSYFNLLSGALGGNVPATAAPHTSVTGGGAEANHTYTQSTNVNDAGSIAPPRAGGAPQYPFNHTTTSESGHVYETDDTPGQERINIRHRTGSGVEIHPDGSTHLHAVGSNYRTVLADDFILVHGSCNIIALGDVGIKAHGKIILDSSGDMDINAGSDFNLNVAGNMTTRVKGKTQEVYESDKTETVQGFSKVAIDQDYQIDAGSMNFSSTDTDINMTANVNMNIAAIDDLRVTTGADVLIDSAGDHLFSADGKSNIASAGEFIAGSTGGDATLTAKGGDAHVAGSGQVNLNAPVVKSSVTITLGGDAGGDPTSDHSENQEQRKQENVKESTEEFDPVDSHETQLNRVDGSYSEGIFKDA